MENKERRSYEVEIDILPLLKAILPKIWIMVLVGAMIAAAVFVTTKQLIDPEYRCGFTAYVNNQHVQSADKDYLTSSDLSASKQLTNTYILIIRSNQILTAAAESIKSDLSYGALKSMVSAEAQGETEIISVRVVSKDPRLAYSLANAIAQTAPEYMSQIVEGSSMKIIDYPVYTTSPLGPNYMRYAILGFIGGFLLVLIIMLIKYFADDTVKSEADIEQRFGLLNLGIIPDIMAAHRKNSDYYYNYYYSYEGKSGENGKGSKKRKKKRSDKSSEKKGEK